MVAVLVHAALKNTQLKCLKLWNELIVLGNMCIPEIPTTT